MKLTLKEATRGRALRFLTLRTDDVRSGCLGEMRRAHPFIFSLLCASPEDLLQYTTDPNHLDTIKYMLYREYVRITGVSPILGLASLAWMEEDSDECNGHMDLGVEFEDELIEAVEKIIAGKATAEEYEATYRTSGPIDIRIPRHTIGI